ncbi:hypothetical protein O3M35_002071 [Rhynocoris fuscipes]|uniref:Amino acid transporter transmembrane domain-containing protein n=1 Tax=Rhynocoris fuscipes TaxID=488301 RepID=A0AAW1CR65_9HEMI
MIHYLKGNIGSGVFAMGDALKNAGLLFGAIGIALLGSICLYNNHLLVNSSVEIKKKLKMPTEPNQPETIALCFEHGPLMFRRWHNSVRMIVKGFIIATQLGFCSIYFIFVSSSMQTVMKDHGYDYDLKVYSAMTLLPILLSAMIRSLKFLTPVSLLSNILMCCGVCLTFYLCSLDLPNVSERKLFADFSTIPLFFGTTIYAFEGISLVIPLHNEMKNQKLFRSTFGVMNIGQIFVIFLAVAMGVVAYLKYGDDVKGSVTLNFQPGTLSELVMSSVALAILLTYAIQFHVAIDLIWWDLVAARGPFRHMTLYELLLRVGLVLFTFIMANVVPHLNLFISLIGAMCSAALALVFPALCDIALRTCPIEEGRLQSKSTARQAWRFFLDAITLIIAITGFITGTFYSVVAIIEAFEQDFSSS